MKMYKKLIFISALSLASIGLVACGGGNSGSGSGELSVSVTDAPIYLAEAVRVNFVGVKVKPAEGEALTFNFCKALVDPESNPPIVQQEACVDSEPHVETIDLLQQTGGASALLLDGVTIPAGRVNWVRLMLAEEAGEIDISGGDFPGTYPLTVPSGDQTGLKLNRGFDVPEDGEAHVYIDFDVRKSIVEVHSTTPPSYKLKPTLRLVDDFGAIAGDVDSGLVTDNCLGESVYVFAGAGTTPDDIERDDGDPVTSALVVADAESATGWSYRVDFLIPGDYTVAFVCADGISQDDGQTFDEPADDPDLDDLLTFVNPQDATVVVDLTTAIDF
jgi:hypothetical protein